jgi:class 3 adenylate cyclase
MRNPLSKARQSPRIRKFSGVGTILMSHIINADDLLQSVAPEDSIEILSRYVKLVCSSIEKHRGVVLQFQADWVLAFWYPHHVHPSHAQLAFDAAGDILDSLPNLCGKNSESYNIEIVLGTGAMAGDFLPPTRQFQIVGKALDVAEHLSRASTTKGSQICLSQYTADLIATPRKLEKIGSIDRDNLDIVVLACQATGAPNLHST